MTKEINKINCDIAIIGAGAAGMMCAIEAGKRGRKTILLDHSTKIGRKILISGGGRCNFTNTGTSPDAFLSENKHFCRSALSRYTPENFIALVKKHQISYHHKKLGQLFCDGSAQNIVDLLLKECEEANVQINSACKINKINKDKHFYIETNQGIFVSESLVIATGGLSIPQIGATGFGYEIAKQFDLNIVTTAPALVGLSLKKQDLNELKELSGLSIDTLVECNKKSFRENILFTHVGLSGPAILQISLYWRQNNSIYIDLLPEIDTISWLSQKKHENPNIELKNILSEILPKRFVDKFCYLYAPSKPIKQIDDKTLKDYANFLKTWTITPANLIGYEKAEVTRGGVDTDELSSQTMESKKVSGLYFIGEVVDVTGQLGGYNFQWAWASGFCAGQYV
jgi:predicted Rossmann fold flavoprotein